MHQTIPPFQFAPMPHIHFGWGIRHQLIEHLKENYRGRVVLITGNFLSRPGEFGQIVRDTLMENNRLVDHFTVSGEPSPDLVDYITSQCKPDTEAVIGIGGGSVLDAAKAIAGLIPSQTSVMDYLEGVGAGKAFDVETCPFIAVPTTAGTGSETTKNSVLSRLGEFKKSFRSDKLLAKEAWLDPELLLSCPKDILYATGMDAFTQLLESYTTLKPNPITDALAWQGMTLFKGAFEAIESENEALQQQGYSRLMLAASLSGTTLANAGLGAVHGLAGPIGAFFEAPHGIVCAKLLAPITEMNIEALHQQDSVQTRQSLEKYVQIGRLLNPDSKPGEELTGLVKILQRYAQTYTPQGLGEFGLSTDNLEPVIKSCRSGSMLGNPVILSDEQLHKAITLVL
ncbi:iron-containing alcohol dehydrogenase [Thiomicrorhabdus sp. ZW0627]|uniref:iron-containing alcohol dehydrogenase n=1 Tax=Thiomicrorhabdus sp. ZW0627 TaxID=3039774 RepID=UPI002436DA99|nr:iron-containing alcohol dehydrogenase [Thiomicrorhabdus sp. ZW0627]MDG6774466.1 iron-containing alcohol dehydrogenase [Thiomicrorhabdus sp. ZW0627]